ncbi:MAG: hypothetical protein M3450_12820 [Actinomycetota bacterium]|nr:hypothetical protein [Actinomycetota bacterium]
MYVQVVTYALGDTQESEYLDVSDELARASRTCRAYRRKNWLDDPDRCRYGALYFWHDKESKERFLRSDLFEGTNVEFTDVESERFAILETSPPRPSRCSTSSRPDAGRSLSSNQESAAKRGASIGRRQTVRTSQDTGEGQAVRDASSRSIPNNPGDSIHIDILGQEHGFVATGHGGDEAVHQSPWVTQSRRHRR